MAYDRLDAEPSAHPSLGTVLLTISGALFVLTIVGGAAWIIHIGSLPPGFFRALRLVAGGQFLVPLCACWA
jgi:hypothetical protein